MSEPKRVVIMGAAGRDFHNFNTAFRDDDSVEVVAFTAEQIPGIDDRQYPPELSGDLYPDGIPIRPERNLDQIVAEEEVDEVVFAYSDVSHEYLMNRASQVHAAGADFTTLGTDTTMLSSTKPVLAVTAVRTGCGKSVTSRRVVRELTERGVDVAAVRHPMPYGDLAKKAVERFATFDDLDSQECTIEEREEYEPYVEMGVPVLAGVDYERVLTQAEEDADVVVWDGGNNDWPFFEPDLQITLADALRPGHEVRYWPGEPNFRTADVILINKVDQADADDIQEIVDNADRLNPDADIIRSESVLDVTDPEAIEGKDVICVDDGPTLTHGGMSTGAAVVAAERHGAAEIIDPRPYAVGSLKETYDEYPHIGRSLPALGYSPQQFKELEETIKASPADLVVEGNPIDLRRIIDVDQPIVRVTYDVHEVDGPDLGEVVDGFLDEQGLA